MKCRLAGRVLAKAGLDDTAHDALVDLRRLNACTAHSLAHHQRTQLRCGERLQRTLKLAHRRPHSRYDHDFSHTFALREQGLGDPARRWIPPLAPVADPRILPHASEGPPVQANSLENFTLEGDDAATGLPKKEGRSIAQAASLHPTCKLAFPRATALDSCIQLWCKKSNLFGDCSGNRIRIG